MISHARQLDERHRERFFAVQPRSLVGASPREIGAALGALLYIPANRPQLTNDLARARQVGAAAVALDLEDAVPVAERGAAVRAVTKVLLEHASFPLVFVRVPEPTDVRAIVGSLRAHGSSLTGFILPKFEANARGREFFAEIRRGEENLGRRLLALPVVETRAVAQRETRLDTLLDIRQLCTEEEARVAGVRIGLTDLRAIFGMRARAGASAYSSAVVASVIGDIVNIFARQGEDGAEAVPVAGGVLEQYGRESGVELADELLADQANGLVGKSVIHPSHVPVVNAYAAVSEADHHDANAIVAKAAIGGAFASTRSTRMNEVAPHLPWARLTLQRAAAFGVIRDGMARQELAASLVRTLVKA